MRRALIAGFLLGFSFTTAYASPDSVKAEVQDDGSVTIEGVRYTDPAPLKGALKEIEHRHGSIELHVHATPLMKFEAIGKAIILLQRAGYTKIGFITEPRPH
ncbi:MAG TPA: hypothetical protein VFI23_02180 [Rhizomicrobium sp.]|nr:hypothetical protein [Rhizomicrobium sp.]